MFWEQFWPSLVSKIIGAFLGFLGAIWTDRLFKINTDREKQLEEKRTVNSSLSTISRALELNHQKMQSLVTSFLNHQAPFDAALDSSAWEAFESEIIQLLHDSSLKQRIAYHFARLERISKLIDMHFDFSIGSSSALTQAQHVQNLLHDHLIPTLNDLVDESFELRKELMEIRSNASRNLNSFRIVSHQSLLIFVLTNQVRTVK